MTNIYHLAQLGFKLKRSFYIDIFMHFELRRYADGAFSLLIEVWDSSASAQHIKMLCFYYYYFYYSFIMVHQSEAAIS